MVGDEFHEDESLDYQNPVTAERLLQQLCLKLGAVHYLTAPNAAEIWHQPELMVQYILHRRVHTWGSKKAKVSDLIYMNGSFRKLLE